MSTENTQKVITRSVGITPEERYLKTLCDRSFLRLWSYPGVYRNQTAGGSSKAGKEVCDLLVVFDNHIIIFSDKHCIFPDTGNLSVDWSRWVRKAILESGRQIFGAERWIRNFPNRLFIDCNCSQPFPIEFPDMNNAKFHRIIVAHGVSERCKKELGGSGSMMIMSDIIGEEHICTEEKCGIPFAIGQVNPQRGYIHVLDDTSLEIVMTTLDTISDFTSYLEKKEQLFSRLDHIVACGEEELLSFYFKNLNNDGEHDFIIPDTANILFVEEDSREHFTHSPERASQIEANKISYAWDSLIEEFITNIMNNTQHFTYPEHNKSPDIVIRFMAKEVRTRRRMLIRSLFELMVKTPKNYKSVRVVLPSKPGEPHYVFLILPHLKNVLEEEYREVRRKLLEAYCLVTKLKFSDALDIIGIATEPGKDEYRSEDALYFDARNWSTELQDEAQRIHNDLGLLNITQTSSYREYEFPASRLE